MHDAPDFRGRLEAIRDRLTDEMVDAEGAALASVAKQLVEVINRLESLPNEKASAVDELRNRRKSRRPPVSDTA